MTMNPNPRGPRWEVAMSTPNGKVKTVTRQPTREDAIAKARRAYPRFSFLTIERLAEPPSVGGRNGNPHVLEAAREANNAARREREARVLEETLAHVTPEGVTPAQMGGAMGITANAIRKRAERLEAMGLVVRERLKKGAILIRRVA